MDVSRIDLEWLTEVLRREGVLDSAAVIKAEVIFAKTLPVSRIVRLGLMYSGESQSSAPKTLFLKLSEPDAARRLPLDASETAFYREVGIKMKGSPIIRCFDVGIDYKTNCSHILMEDLTESHFQPESPKPPSLEQSEGAVTCLARFHAAWMDDPLLGNGVGKYFDREWLGRFTHDLATSFMEFADGVGLSTHRRRIYDRVLDASELIWGRLTIPEGLTVTNGDTHWWNFLYPNDPAVDEVRLFDWQLWHLDLGARDLAFLVALGGFAERRPAIERRLIELYFESLVRFGVQDYTWDTFFHDYRLSAIRNLNIPVIFWSQGRMEAEWRPLLERAFAGFDALGCEELI